MKFYPGLQSSATEQCVETLSYSSILGAALLLMTALVSFLYVRLRSELDDALLEVCLDVALMVAWLSFAVFVFGGGSL